MSEIDKLSGRIVALLADYNGQMNTRQIADRLDADRRKCLYRLSKKLKPQNLVKEVYNESGKAKNWKLTRSGRELVESEDLSKYRSFEHRMAEVEGEVEKAVREAESAKNSVQRYRGKVNYWMEKIEALESELGDIEDIGETYANVDYVDSRIHGIKRSVDDTAGRVTEVEEDIEALEGRIADIADMMAKVSTEVEEMRSGVSEERIEKLEEKLDKLDAETKKGFF